MSISSLQGYTYIAGSPAPAGQSLSVQVGTLEVDFSAAAADSWVQVNPGSGITPATVGVSVNPAGLGPGRHTSSVVVNAPDSLHGTASAAVTLDVRSRLNVAPTALSFTQPAGARIANAGQLSLLSSLAGLEVNIASGSPWLDVGGGSAVLPSTVPISIDTTGLAPGTYDGIVRISSANAVPSSLSVPVQLEVTGAAAKGMVRAQPGGLVFLSQPGVTTNRGTIAITNTSSSGVAFSVSASSQPDGWLAVSGGSGAAALGQPAAATVEVTPGDLTAGTYLGQVTFTGPPGTPALTVPVTLIVPNKERRLVISQTGLTLRVATGGSPVSGSFSILQEGGAGGPLNWEIAQSTLSGGSWLSVQPAKGSSAFEMPGTEVRVTADPAGLAPGVYYGQLLVTSPDAVNSGQPLTIVLQVTAPTDTVEPLVAPASLTFVDRGETVPSQTVTLTNVGASVLSFTAAVNTAGGQSVFQATPQAGDIQPGKSLDIQVQSDTAKLDAGAYRGALTVAFAQMGQSSFRKIDLLTVVTPAARADAAASPEGSRAAGNPCVTEKLYPMFVSTGSGFTTTAAWPTALVVRTIDDCGDPLRVGSVRVSFSNGDPPLPMTSLRDGSWGATWTGRNDRQGVVLTATATGALGTPVGGVTVSGDLAPNSDPPVIASGYVVNSASSHPFAPLGLGTLISIYGSRLADDVASSTGGPEPTVLGDTEAVIDGQSVPLGLVSPNQVNGILPFQLSDNLPHLLVIRHGDSISSPEPLSIVRANPAVFTLDGSGSGGGVIIAVRPDGQQFLVTPETPARGGDVIVIYCAGLGAVNPPLAAGAQTPTDVLYTVQGATAVTIGGKDAQVLFAGLAPGFSGLYQVNAVVPDGLVAGADVPLRVTTDGLGSDGVTIAVE